MTSPIYNNIGGLGSNLNVDEHVETKDTKAPKYEPTFGLPSEDGTEKDTKPKMPTLDYTSFPKKSRAYANDLATRSLNEVKDLARAFSKDFPATAYTPPYGEFPKPEDFSAKNLGGKEAAFNAWKDAVKEWVEDCKQDMQALKDTGMQDLQKQMNENFIRSWVVQGFTRDFIIGVLDAHHNDTKAAMQELKELVQNESARTRGTVQQESRHLKETIGDQAEFTRAVVEDNAMRTRDTVRDQAEYTRSTVRKESRHLEEAVTGAVETEGAKTRDKIDANKEEEAEKAKLREKINLALRNEPAKTKKAIRTVLEQQGMRFDGNSSLDRGGNSNLPAIIDNLDKRTLDIIVGMLTETRNPWTR